MAKKTREPVLEFEEYTQADAARDEAERQAAGGRFLKIVVGRNEFRILPARPGERWKRVYWRHFVDLPGGGIASFVCPRMETKGARQCKACTREKKLRASGNPLDEKQADRYKPQRKVLCNAINRKNEDVGPASLEYGTGIDKDLTEMREVEDVDFTHPLHGSDIVILKTGHGRSQTRYKVKEGKHRPLHEDVNVMRDWIANQADLSQYVKLEDDEAIEARLRGEDPRDSRGAGGGRTERRPSRKEPVDEMDLTFDDDEDDAGDEDDEWEEIAF